MSEKCKSNPPEQPEASVQEEKSPRFGRFSRRSFLGQLGAAGAAAAVAPILGSHVAQAQEETAAHVPPPGPGTIPVTLSINGAKHSLNFEPRVTLLDFLRERVDLTGTKKGCDHGQCGACTVHINGRRVNSCLTLAAMHQGDEITTIEGLGQPGRLHPMQAAFVEQDGYQCGACTSGQIMSGVAMMKEKWGPTDADVKQAMYGNICRCGAYPNIVAAVQQVRKQQQA
jgi:xanthine dehydrogenase YagT iron-sulfur-binding subunit